MKKIQVIPTEEGRVTIQENAAGIPEIKVRRYGKTFKITCTHENPSNIIETVEALLASSPKVERPNQYGGTFVVRFDVEHPAIQKIMVDYKTTDSDHPKELMELLTSLKNKYDYVCEPAIRWMRALPQYEIMGVLLKYEDLVDVCLDVYHFLVGSSYTYIHGLGTGIIFLPGEHQKMGKEELLHWVTGHGVFSAFQVFKRDELTPNQQHYIFYSYHHDFQTFNESIERLTIHQKELKKELRILQSIDEGTQRYTSSSDD